MLLVNKLTLQSQWVYRIEPPKGRYFIDFKLDPKSTYHLVEEARKLNSQREVENFQRGIEEAAITTALKIPKRELTNQRVAEYMRIQVDPKYTGKLFAFQVKTGDNNNHLIITKAELLQNDEEVDDVETLTLPHQQVSTNIWIKPISIDYVLDDHTQEHLNNYARELQNTDDIEDLERQIRRAVRIAAHKMVESGIIHKPSPLKIRFTFRDLISLREFIFIFTIINGRRFLVNKVRIRDY